jgi:uncharacterized membrane protein
MGKINDLKDQALATLNGKWGSFVGLTFIYLLIYSLCCFLAMFGTIFEGSSFTGLAVTFSFIGSILMVLLIPMGYGYMVAYLHSSRQDLPAEIGDLFFGFRKGQFARVLGTYILLGLILMVAMIPYFAFISIMAARGQMGNESKYGFFLFIMLLLMIPMYVVALAYALVPFLLRDEPELSAREILTKSRVMMKGHKGELFILMLSFIGWGVLALFTFGIGYLWLAPYMCMTFTKYYEQLRAEYEGVADEGGEQPVVEEPAPSVEPVPETEEPAPAEDNE